MLLNDRLIRETYRSNEHIRIADCPAAVAFASRVFDQRYAPGGELASRAIAGLDLPGSNEDEREPALQMPALSHERAAKL